MQQKLTETTVLSVTYVGTRGVHLFRRWNLNTPPPGTTSLNSRLPFRYFNQQGQQYATYIDDAQANGGSIYHGMQAQLKTHIRRNLEGNFSFTWSKEIDDMNMWWPLDDRYNRAVGNSQAPDVPHSFVGSFTYQLPFGRGQRWLSSTTGPAQILFGGLAGKLHYSASIGSTDAHQDVDGRTGQRCHEQCRCHLFFHQDFQVCLEVV